jgi:cobalt-zinc-cadmium efflux system membrane fusion protein
MNSGFRYLICLAVGLLSLFLPGCRSNDHEAPQSSQTSTHDEVILGGDSPKREYIKDKIIEPIQRPLMEPVTGKIVYDESNTARISSPVSGRVTGAIAGLGDQIHSGDTLVEIDSPELGQAQSAYRDAVADLKLAKLNYERTKELFDNDIAPRKEWELMEDKLIHARSEAERARLKLANLGADNLRLDNRFVLHSPISGIVTERNINPGMEVRPDLPTPLFVISDLDQLWAQMVIFEKDIGLIHVGTTVLLEVPAYPGEEFKATVSYISKVVDETTRTVKVRCIVPNLERKLLPAMFARLTVLSNIDDLSIVVPLDALFVEDESDWVYVNTGDYHYQLRPVKVGLRLKDRAVILSGLKPGERLVVNGALMLRAEQKTEQQARESRQ